MNYGAIGVVIGHEITHGFDDQGRQYDGTGNAVPWWSQETIDAFTEPITECLKSVRMSLSSLCETTWGLALFLNKPEERQPKKYIHVWVKNSELLSD